MPLLRATPNLLALLLDGDSDEAKAFTTYLGYWDAYADTIAALYGGGAPVSVGGALRHSSAYRKLNGRRYQGPAAPVQQKLLGAWQHELSLYLVDDPALMHVANHGAAVTAYYSTASAGLAWLQVLTGNQPSRHQSLLKAMAQSISERPNLYRSPWNLRCTSREPTVTYEGFLAPPEPCSNLGGPANPHDRIAQCLRTTRQRRINELVEETKRQRRLSRAPHGERARRDHALEATTLLDFLWRARTRSSYGDPAMFYMGTMSDERATAFMDAVRLVTSTTVALFETLIAARAPELVFDTASHFLSRDRSNLTLLTLEPRIQALAQPLQVAGSE